MPDCCIEITNEIPRYRLSKKKIRSTLGKILKVLGWKKAGLGLWLVSDRKMSRLNWQYLHHRGPTDVISFSLLERRSRPQKGSDPFYVKRGLTPFVSPLGDLIISMDTTARQARQYGNCFEYEFFFYVCHGILHLMGYDDRTPKQAKAMERKQMAILRKIGVKNRQSA